jgi:hypothetical protein
MNDTYGRALWRRPPLTSVHAYTIGLAYRAAGTLNLLKGDWATARSLQRTPKKAEGSSLEPPALVGSARVAAMK